MGAITMPCPVCGGPVSLDPEGPQGTQCHKCGWQARNGKAPHAPTPVVGKGDRGRRRTAERTAMREEKKRRRQEWKDRFGR